MPTPDLSAKLPPPHDEEPAQLRSDILDELQDHLTCAADRERRRLGLTNQPVDAVTIWQSVIERFGDPSALARRLWFDAMQGQLMTQRVLLGAVAVLAAVVVFFGWQMTTTLSAVVDQNQKATAAILERLGKEAPASAPSGSPEWIPVKYRLVQGTADGPPVVGKKIALSQQTAGEGGSRLTEMSEVTNAEGIADFGLLPYGTYQFTIASSTGVLNEAISIRPGRPIDMRIVMPVEQKIAEVKFEYSPPDWKDWGWRDGKPPQDYEPCLLVAYKTPENEPVDGRHWKNRLSSAPVLVRADGMYTIRLSTEQLGGVRLGPENRIESVKMLAQATAINAKWFLLGDLNLLRSSSDPSARRVAQSPFPNSNSNSHVFSSAYRRLTPEFVAESRKKAEQMAEKMPLTIQIEAGVEPMVVRIPSNHPALIDGVGMPEFGGRGF